MDILLLLRSQLQRANGEAVHNQGRVRVLLPCALSHRRLSPTLLQLHHPQRLAVVSGSKRYSFGRRHRCLCGAFRSIVPGCRSEAGETDVGLSYYRTCNVFSRAASICCIPERIPLLGCRWTRTISLSSPPWKHKSSHGSMNGRTAS